MTRGHRQLAAYLFLVAMMGFGFWVDHQQDIERCEARNEGTQDSVSILADAIVRAASDADPQRVAAFRDDIEARLVAARVDCT